MGFIHWHHHHCHSHVLSCKCEWSEVVGLEGKIHKVGMITKRNGARFNHHEGHSALAEELDVKE